MKVTIEEFVISGENITKDHGTIYKQLGLDVVHDSHNMRILSTNKAKIISLSGGIHIHTKVPQSNCPLSTSTGVSSTSTGVRDSTSTEMVDALGNKIIVTFVRGHPHNSIAIITSGGDAPGMNASIKAIVRRSLKAGDTVYGVYRGYEGLVNDYICKLGWDTETHSSAEGGTVLLSFRSKNFLKREFRKQAVLNLVKRGINCLVVLGGDGSLKGALTLQKEFKELFLELIEEGKLSSEDLSNFNDSKETNSKSNFNDSKERNYYEKFYGEPECYKEIPKFDINKVEEPSSVPVSSIYDLKIVGIPASIDNDIWGSDYTLGADTAMNRVMESIDHLSSTMRSHQRIFVIEVMGRTCGWLTMLSGFSCLADYVLIPEDPPGDWRYEVMQRVMFAKKHGKPGIFILVSEGACDREGKEIASGDIVSHIASFDIDVRLLKLGHVQRGGPTSAFDRTLGTLLGIQAFQELSSTRTSRLVCYANGDVKALDLEEVIRKNDQVKDWEKNLEFEKILQARGTFFNTVHKFYREILDNKMKIEAPFMDDINLKVLLADNLKLQEEYKDKNKGRVVGRKKKIGIMQCGSRASGMNTALNAMVQYCFVAGLEPVYILNGFDGLLQCQAISSKLYEFSGDYNNGGASLGLGDLKYVDIQKVKSSLQEQEIENLIIIGDSDCLNIINKLCTTENGTTTPLNIILVPASSSNNLPSTDISLGCDTSLNTIVRVSDCAKLSAFSMKKSVFVLEVAGENCGFLTLIGGIAAGAFDSFIPERKYLISHLSETAHRLRSRFKASKRNGIVIFRNERTFCSISSESFCRVLKTDGKGLFETDYAVMGRLQQGLNPSPIDRVNATLFGIKAVKSCIENLGCGIVGLNGDRLVFTGIEIALNSFDQKTRTVKNPRWIKYSNISKSIE
ncbi:ATP-dependent 6-phosphofructokinase subunit alpha [Nosema granulosis]|uniref:6-phosphofructokinase n=1 Tax=Nosema granulosis TaxID=83296 RepID=A0A9P6GWT3_9MICR|nr:ATP-dependent 6-phosphofructokinase subunit alpha [Nosema granulosis]